MKQIALVLLSVSHVIVGMNPDRVQHHYYAQGRGRNQGQNQNQPPFVLIEGLNEALGRLFRVAPPADGDDSVLRRARS